MKKVLFVLCLISASAAFAQMNGGAASVNSEPRTYTFSSHPAHAGYAAMSQEQSILGSASYSFAQGDRRASDFPQPEAVSLGAVAREFRKEHARLANKSRVVWVNQ